MAHYDKKTRQMLAVYVFIFILLAIGLVVSGYVSYHNFEQEFSRQAGNQISAIAELKVGELVNWRRERLGDAKSFYHNPVFSSLSARYFENLQDTQVESQILARFESYKTNGQYERICLLDATGTLALSIPPAPDAVDACLAGNVTVPLDIKEITFLDFQRGANKADDIYIALLVPIFADPGDERLLGILVLRVDPEIYLYPYINRWPIPSDTAETLLVRREGDEMLFLSDLRFVENAALNLRHPLSDEKTPMAAIAQGQTGVVEGRDYRGESVLADVRPVPDSPWFLVTKMDIAEVYAPLRQRLSETLLIVSMAIFVAGLGLITIWRQQRLLFYRTQAEAAMNLRESEEKFRKAFVLSPDSININRAQDGMYVLINQGFTKIMGYTPEEAVGKTSLELNIWDDPQERQIMLDGIRKNGEVSNFEARFRAKNGDIKYGLMSCSMLELNGVPHILSITRNITGRRQAEDALRASEENLFITLHSIGDGVISTDKSGLIVSMNPVAEKYCGWMLADARGRPLAEVFNIINAETRQKVENPIERVLESGQVVGLANHTVLISRTGGEYQISDSAAPIKNKEGEITGVVLVFSDVTEKYKATEKLRQSESNFADIFQMVSEGIAYTTLGGQVISVNDSFERILEIPREQLVGKNILSLARDLLPAKNIKKILPILINLIQGREVHELEVEYKNKTLELTASVNRNSGKLAAVARDITGRKQAESALRENEEKYRRLFDNAPLGIFQSSPDDKVIAVNQAFSKMLGYASPEEAMENIKSISTDIFADPNRRSEIIGLMSKNPELRTFENVYRRRDGSTFLGNLNVIPIRDADGRLLRLEGIVEDITERKQIEDALIASREFSNSLVASIQDGISVLNIDRTHVVVNPALCAMTGFSFEELMYSGPAPYPYWPPEEYEPIQAAFKRMFENDFDNFELIFMRKNGERFPVIVSSSAVKDKDGNVIYYMATVKDITERKQAEESLRSSEERFRTHYDNTTIGLYRTTPAGRIMLLNPAGVKMLGFDSFDEISRRNLETAGFEAAYPRSEFHANLARDGVVIGLESKWTRKDGSTIFVRESAKAFYDTAGKILYYDGSFEDVSGRVQAEAALRESEEHYRTVVSHAPVVTFVTNEKGIFTLSEGKGLAKLGLQPGQVVGLSVFDVYHDYPTILAAMKNALAGYSQRDEVEVQGIVFDVFYTPVFDPQGKVTRVIGVANDVTERKQSEDKIRQFNIELEQRVRERTLQLETTNKELEAFSYSVSHDLRAPLRGIDGWSQALLEDYQDKLDEQGVQYIARVRAETQHMGSLIDDMLQLSRLTRAEMVREKVDLSALAQSVVGRLRRDDPDRQVDFIIQPGIAAEGDPHLLDAVFFNLLGNAFKFTSKCAEARIEFGQTESQSPRVFFVRDNGAGFDMDYAQKLFGAFQRMHKASEFPGTGVGLAIVQRVIHRHGGRVWAEAEVGRGATFFFTLEEVA